MCVLRNRKFKYYKDLECKQLAGVVDFERINCVIVIDEEQETQQVKDQTMIDQLDSQYSI